MRLLVVEDEHSLREQLDRLTALVREIAVLHGGSATVESSSENGTTFAVTLPLAQPC